MGKIRQYRLAKINKRLDEIIKSMPAIYDNPANREFNKKMILAGLIKNK